MKILKYVFSMLAAASILCATFPVYSAAAARQSSASARNDFKNVDEIEAAKDDILSEYITGISNRENELERGKITINGQTMEIPLYLRSRPSFWTESAGKGTTKTVRSQMRETLSSHSETRLKERRMTPR